MCFFIVHVGTHLILDLSIEMCTNLIFVVQLLALDGFVEFVILLLIVLDPHASHILVRLCDHLVLFLCDKTVRDK